MSERVDGVDSRDYRAFVLFFLPCSHQEPTNALARWSQPGRVAFRASAFVLHDLLDLIIDRDMYVKLRCGDPNGSPSHSECHVA